MKDFVLWMKQWSRYGKSIAKTRRGESGFSMIELMVVIVILGMLATLVAVNVLGTLDTASIEAAKTQISTFRTALMAYRIEFKKFPNTSEGLQALVQNPKNKRFLDSSTIPKDPWGNDYQYKAPGPNNEPYEIVCLGSDGQQGGSEDAADIVSWNLKGEGN